MDEPERKRLGLLTWLAGKSWEWWFVAIVLSLAVLCEMKQRGMYWWIFAISGEIWFIGYAGLILGCLLAPKSNLLGGYALIYGPVFWLGCLMLTIALIVWIPYRLLGLLFGLFFG